LAGTVADVYWPGGAPPVGTVVVCHGINPLGKRDPRMVVLARALSGVGFVAVVPNVAPMAALEVTGLSRQVFCGCVRAVAEDPVLNPRGGQVAVVGASMAGSLALLAASEEGTREVIGAVCCVGSFGCTARASLRAMSGHPTEDDPYARNLLMLNFLHLAPAAAALAYSSTFDAPPPALAEKEEAEEPGFLRRLAAAFRLALLDSHAEQLNSPGIHLLPAYLAAHPDVAAAFHSLHASPTLRAALAAEMAHAASPTLAALSPSLALANVSCRHVVLLHGVRDEVVHVEEARGMAEALRGAKGVGGVTLCETELMTHGGLDEGRPRGAGLVREVWRVLAAVGVFLGAAEEAGKEKVGKNKMEWAQAGAGAAEEVAA